MNYYEHHIGDYDSATAHLSLLEDGVYSRLIRLCYRTEQPLPTDVKSICRLVRAVTKQERDAVANMLAEFFVLHEDGWHQLRCDAEILRFQDKQAKAKRSANARWNAVRPQSEGNANASEESMRTHSDGNANGMHRAPVPRHQTPDTNHQTPDPNTHTHTAPSTDAGRVCRLMRKAGIPDSNTGHPDLLALIAAGATDAEFEQAARTSADKGKGFAYALGVLKGQRIEAAALAQGLHHGPLPESESPHQRAARERMQAAVPGIAARAPQAPATSTMSEVIDVTARRLG